MRLSVSTALYTCSRAVSQPLLSFSTFFSVSVSDRSRSAISHSSRNWLTALSSSEAESQTVQMPCVVVAKAPRTVSRTNTPPHHCGNKTT